MNRITWLFVFSLFASSALACDSRAVFTATNGSGAKTGLFLSQDDFLASPDWDPAAGSPPLSIGSAISIAFEWAKRANEKYDGVVFAGLSLHEYSCRSGPTYWYYVVDFTPTFDGNEVFGARSWVAVLLDGSVIGPTEMQE